MHFLHRDNEVTAGDNAPQLCQPDQRGPITITLPEMQKRLAECVQPNTQPLLQLWAVLRKDECEKWQTILRGVASDEPSGASHWDFSPRSWEGIILQIFYPAGYYMEE